MPEPLDLRIRIEILGALRRARNAGRLSFCRRGARQAAGPPRQPQQ